MQLVQMYSPPKMQGNWAPAKAIYRTDLAMRPVMGQLEKLLGAGIAVQALEAGIGGTIAYLGFYNGAKAKGAHKWLGWVVGLAGSLYTLSALTSMFKLGQVKQVVEKVSQ
jgi:uncharacterized membrane protein YdcZ (DUF606 family)